MDLGIAKLLCTLGIERAGAATHHTVRDRALRRLPVHRAPTGIVPTIKQDDGIRRRLARTTWIHHRWLRPFRPLGIRDTYGKNEHRDHTILPHRSPLLGLSSVA
jgi:hypothetical protein